MAMDGQLQALTDFPPEERTTANHFIGGWERGGGSASLHEEDKGKEP
jgi:hypothetical protein